MAWRECLSATTAWAAKPPVAYPSAMPAMRRVAGVAVAFGVCHMGVPRRDELVGDAAAVVVNVMLTIVGHPPSEDRLVRVTRAYVQANEG